MAVASAIVSAAVDDDQAQGWIDVLEDPRVTFDALSDRGKEPSLDSKLRAALLKNSSGDQYFKHQDLMDTIARESRRVKRRFADEGIDRTIRGRQILWIIRDFHGVDAGKRTLFNIKALTDYVWSGDAHLVRWKLHWDYMIENQKTPLDDEQILPIFLEKIAHSVALKNYVDYFNRLGKGDLEYTYAWLSLKVDKYIRDNRERLNQENLNAGGNSIPKKGAAATTPGSEAPVTKKAAKKAAAAAKAAEAGTTPAAAAGGAGGGRGKGEKGKGRGKGDKGRGKAANNADKGQSKKGYAADGTQLRCVWHWFGKCKSHPLQSGQVCKFGPHVPEPSKAERDRPAFKKCEELHGAWATGKFKYPTAAAAKKAETDETPPVTPR